jgi:hypothetical protein
MCYLFNSNEVVNYLQESVKAIETMVSQMEPEQLPVDYEKNHYQINLGHARHIEDLQSRIMGWCANQCVLLALVPDALVIWNLRRMSLGRGKILLYF